MIAVAESRWASPRWPLWRFLRDELTLSPSRRSRILRMTAAVTIVTIVSMALRVPDVALSAFLIFMVSAADVKTSARIGVGGAVGVTVAVALTLVLFSLTLAEPALRVPAMAGVIFAGMYFMRVSAAGPLAWIIGFVTAYALTFGDRGIPPEKLTRFVLWAWVFVAYPVALFIILDVVLGRRPEDVFRDGIAERLEAAAAFIDAPAADESPARMRVERLERAGTGSLSAYVKAGLPSGAAARASILRQVDLLLLLLREIPAEAKRAPEMQGALARAGEACREARKALLGDEGVTPERFASLERETGGGATPAAALAVVVPLLACVRHLGLAILDARKPVASEDRGTAGAGAPAPGPSAAPPVDRSEAARFAAKVTLAAMIAYVIYTSLDWSGIHTAMLTCMIVAEASLGATIHKFTLRITGALVGAALGIGAIVFVLPHLETIGGLCVLVASVTLLGAWIATGSQAIAYAGVQLGFAFYMTVLQGFSRTSEMSVGRDRVIGILLGNLIMSVVFMTLWPVRIKPSIRQALARATEALAKAMRLGSRGAPAAEIRDAEIAFHTNLKAAAQHAAARRLEPADDDGWSLVPAIQSLFVRIHAIVHQPLDLSALPLEVREAISALGEGVASWLSQLASALAMPRAIPAYRPATETIEKLERFLGRSGGDDESLASLRLRAGWLALVDADIERIVAREGALRAKETAA